MSDEYGYSIDCLGEGNSDLHGMITVMGIQAVSDPYPTPKGHLMTKQQLADVRAGIWLDVLTERARQERLREAGKFTHTCASPGITDATCIRVLQEEVDEVLDDADTLRRAMGKLSRLGNDEMRNHANFKDSEVVSALRKELIEVMAVACAWAERISSDNLSATN